MKKETITYGQFTNSEWHTLNGLESAQPIIDKLKRATDWTGFQLWVHGSILCDVDTQDIDVTIMGPLIPHKINELLWSCVKTGFENQVYVDVKYSISNELYDPVNDTPKTIRYATYDDRITVNGSTYIYGEKIGDLYLVESKFPMAKTKMSKLAYKSPIRVI